MRHWDLDGIRFTSLLREYENTRTIGARSAPNEDGPVGKRCCGGDDDAPKADSVLFSLGVDRAMSSPDEPVEIDVEFDDGLLTRIDCLRHGPGYETRSDVVAAAIEAASE